MTALFKRTTISPVFVILKREVPLRTMIGDPYSAGTARTITRNHGSYYKTVPEGELSCSTLCAATTAGKVKEWKKRAGYGWRKVRSRASRPSLEISPSRWGGGGRGQGERGSRMCPVSRTLRNYVQRWRVHVVPETMGIPYGE